MKILIALKDMICMIVGFTVIDLCSFNTKMEIYKIFEKEMIKLNNQK